MYWRSLMTLLFCEWYLIPKWLLRSIFAWFLEQHLEDLVSWGSPGEVLPVLKYCSTLWCSAADAHHKPLDRAVSGARFLTGGVFECDIAHRRSVTILCMMYKIRCNPMHSLKDALPGPYVSVRIQVVPWSHIGILIRRLAAEPRSNVGLLYLS